MPRIKLRSVDWTDAKSIPICKIDKGRFAVTTYRTTVERAHLEIPVARARERGTFEPIIAAHFLQYQRLVNEIAAALGVSDAQTAEWFTWFRIEQLATKPELPAEKPESGGARFFRVAYAVAPDFLLAALAKIRAIVQTGMSDKDRVYLALNQNKEIQIGRKLIPIADATDGELAMAFKVSIPTAKSARQYKSKIDKEVFGGEWPDETKGILEPKRIPLKKSK